MGRLTCRDIREIQADLALMTPDYSKKREKSEYLRI
jgi:hypothetical protein